MRNARVTYRLIILILALIFGFGFSVPSFFQTQSGAKISLGLDLQGGLHMLLGVETNEAIHSKIKSQRNFSSALSLKKRWHRKAKTKNQG